MITVTSEYNAAQYADVAQYISQVFLVLGNYAASKNGSTVASSGDDASGNFPALGAIDSDRTEINIGAASGADNGVGKSSWKSSLVPDGSGNVYLEIDFNATRIFNRVKLYNLASDPLTSYLIQYWDGSVWQNFAGSPDRYTPAGSSGYGSGGYGSGPYGGSGSWPGLGYTGNLDVYDFSDITSTKIKIIVYSTTNADAAQIVEVEVYRKIDITSRVLGFKIDRKRDLKLYNPMATQADIECDNTDQFFSISYTPTAAQVTAGFVNSELAQLAFDVEINEGFVTSLGTETIRTFTGSADSITINARPGTVDISARDYMKHLINQVDSSGLKTAIDIKDAVKYVLNRNNVSTYEMLLRITGINEDYFFTFESSILTSIQQLVQAAGDAAFFYDENGYANFQFYLNNQVGTYMVQTQGDWQTGSLTNIDTISTTATIRREWFLIDDFFDGDYTSNPVWTATGAGAFTVSVASGFLPTGNSLNLTCNGNSSATFAQVQLSSSVFSQFYGTFACKGIPFQSIGGGMGANNHVFTYWWFNYNYGLRIGNYTDGVSNYYSLYLVKNPASITVVNGSDAGILTSTAGAQMDIRVTVIAGSGTTNFKLYINNVLTIDFGSDSDFMAGAGMMIQVTGISGSGSWESDFYVKDIYWSQEIDTTSATTNAQATWISPSIDQSITVQSEGAITSNVTAPPGTTVTFYTRTSPDNVAWTAWAAIDGMGNILSTPQRYLQVRIIIADPIDSAGNNANTIGAYATSFSLQWLFGSGQNKWTTGINFYLAYNSEIVDLQQQLSDNLGGDTAIINDITVTSSPTILGGTSSDTTWQGTAGTPAAAISGSNVLSVINGTQTFNIVVDGGMDTTNMGAVNSGAGGGSIALTFSGGAVGSAQITYVHPTRPILTLTITNPGNITDLRLIGKTFQNAQTPYTSNPTDGLSIARHRRRASTINNNYIVSNAIAVIIANKIISNFKNPTLWIPKLDIIPKINMQIGDQVNVTELISGVAANYYVVGHNRSIRVSKGKAQASMQVALISIPTS